MFQSRCEFNQWSYYRIHLDSFGNRWNQSESTRASGNKLDSKKWTRHFELRLIFSNLLPFSCRTRRCWPFNGMCWAVLSRLIMDKKREITVSHWNSWRLKSCQLTFRTHVSEFYFSISQRMTLCIRNQVLSIRIFGYETFETE